MIAGHETTRCLRFAVQLEHLLTSLSALLSFGLYTLLEATPGYMLS